MKINNKYHIILFIEGAFDNSKFIERNVEMTTQESNTQEVCGQRLLTTKEASFFIAMSEHWLKAARFRPELAGPRYAKIGKCVRYDIQDLEVWLEEKKLWGTHETPSIDRRASS